jgi:hypothetical protein
MRSRLIWGSLCVAALVAFALFRISSGFLTGNDKTLSAAEIDVYRQAANMQVQAALKQSTPLPWDPHGLVVSTDAVAKAIHAAVAGSIYGDAKVQKERPFRAVRSGDFWVVFGSLPKGTAGGTAVTVIRASNGEVLRVIHGK